MGDGDAPVGFESDWLCAVCSAQMIPRDKNAKYCSKRCYERATYLASRTRPAYVEGVRTRCRDWYRQNAAYQCAATRLRKRGLLTEERGDALKRALGGRGALAKNEVDDLLSSLGLTFVRRKTRSKVIEVSRSPAREDPEITVEDGPSLWERPSPACTHLPQTAVRLRGALEPAWHSVFAYRVYSALTKRMRLGHTPRMPTHCIVFDCGEWWTVCRPEATERLPGSFVLVTQRRSGRYDETRIEVDPARFRLRAPAPIAAGQYRVRVRMLTPLAVRAASRGPNKRIRTHDLMDLRGSLAAVSERVGLRYHESELHAAVIDRDTATVDTVLNGHVQRGEKRGKGTGLAGSLVIECNAPALWLLRCAALIGLGSDTSRGFGRVRVEDA